MVDVADVAGSRLIGRTLGTQHFATFAGELESAEPGQIVEFDFDHVEVVTASWIVGAFVPLMRLSAESRIDSYPVLCGVDGDLRDDFEFVSEQTGQPYVDWCPRNRRSKAKLIGRLESQERETLKAVAVSEEATGADLKRSMPDVSVSASGWNNRLRDLHQKRLLRRRTEGRRQLYSLTFPEIV